MVYIMYKNSVDKLCSFVGAACKIVSNVIALIHIYIKINDWQKCSKENVMVFGFQKSFRIFFCVWIYFFQWKALCLWHNEIGIGNLVEFDLLMVYCLKYLCKRLSIDRVVRDIVDGPFRKKFQQKNIKAKRIKLSS